MTEVAATTALPPAGWYVDPLGTPARRWWNGTAWTKHVKPLADAAPADGGADAQDGTALSLETSGDSATASAVVSEAEPVVDEQPFTVANEHHVEEQAEQADASGTVSDADSDEHVDHTGDDTAESDAVAPEALDVVVPEEAPDNSVVSTDDTSGSDAETLAQAEALHADDVDGSQDDSAASVPTHAHDDSTPIVDEEQVEVLDLPVEETQSDAESLTREASEGSASVEAPSGGIVLPDLGQAFAAADAHAGDDEAPAVATDFWGAPISTSAQQVLLDDEAAAAEAFGMFHRPVADDAEEEALTWSSQDETVSEQDSGLSFDLDGDTSFVFLDDTEPAPVLLAEDQEPNDLTVSIEASEPAAEPAGEPVILLEQEQAATASLELHEAAQPDADSLIVTTPITSVLDPRVAAAIARAKRNDADEASPFDLQPLEPAVQTAAPSPEVAAEQPPVVVADQPVAEAEAVTDQQAAPRFTADPGPHWHTNPDGIVDPTEFRAPTRSQKVLAFMSVALVPLVALVAVVSGSKPGQSALTPALWVGLAALIAATVTVAADDLKSLRDQGFDLGAASIFPGLFGPAGYLANRAIKLEKNVQRQDWVDVAIAAATQVLAVVLSAVVCHMLVSSTTVVDSLKVQRDVKAQIEKQVPGVLVSVTCPASVEVEAPATIQCKVRSNKSSDTLPLNVQILDRSGKFTWQSPEFQ